jgi:Integrase core domain
VTGSHRDERVGCGCIRPAHRQRELLAVAVEEEHPILRPRLSHRHDDEYELSPEPRVERVRHSNGSLTNNGIEAIDDPGQRCCGGVLLDPRARGPVPAPLHHQSPGTPGRGGLVPGLLQHPPPTQLGCIDAAHPIRKTPSRPTGRSIREAFTIPGEVERFEQTQKKWLTARPAATIAELQHLCDQFRRYYNQYRPHRALDKATPTQAYTRRPKATPNGYIIPAHCRVRTDTIDAAGVITIRYNSRLHHIGLLPRWSGTHMNSQLPRDFTKHKRTRRRGFPEYFAPVDKWMHVRDYRSCL